MGYMVIATYRPKQGKDQELLALVRDHVPRLRKEGLVTERRPLVLRTRDGALLEIFEWASKEAVDKAHTSPAVLKMWEEFGAVCDYEKLAHLAESQELFAHFEPVDL
ncbi:MAG TPA: hypothetical protein VH877_26365 [Polyangia bacterium]|nr:hypothetical protein [Polyangia bacterium]